MQTRRELLLWLADRLMLPVVYPAAWLFRNIRRVGLHQLPLSRDAMLRMGMIPVRDHYYEPRINFHSLVRPLNAERELPGINWNLKGQLSLLQEFIYAGELNELSARGSSPIEFRFGNGTFESGDAEFWYQLIRSKFPKRIIEIGSGNSTLVARKAIAANMLRQPGYSCEHTCIEPYEMPWLESTGVRVIRQRVENVGREVFDSLKENDILFIDSSHVIRPQGDVLFEYLEILPALNPGVIVHVHDIFSPRDCPQSWVTEEIKLWNEQYLLEAFLSHNSDWEVIGALNMLHHLDYESLKQVAPFLSPSRQPGSFYIQRIAKQS